MTKKKVITFADAQFWDMKILGGMLPDYCGGYIPPWICTHGYEEVRNYRKTLFIQSIVENGWWGDASPTSPPWIRPWGGGGNPRPPRFRHLCIQTRKLMDLASQSFVISCRHLILQSVFQVKLPNTCKSLTSLDFNSIFFEC